MEVWKDIKGYEGLYQISNLGRVKSLPKYNYKTERILTPTDNGNGYKIIGLHRNGKRFSNYIHRLVAVAFVPNPKGERYVNHLDYNTANNTAENLEWCSQKENTKHSSERMKRPHKQWKQTKTGEKHIYYRGNKFRVCIPKVIDKTFHTLEDAIRVREVILNGEKYLAN